VTIYCIVETFYSIKFIVLKVDNSAFYCTFEGH
jgi:hypothetical protein